MSGEADGARLVTLLSATSKRAEEILQRATKIKTQMELTEEVSAVLLLISTIFFSLCAV
jgi:hypothetical protein